jgi:nucleoid DNA-binding protein
MTSTNLEAQTINKGDKEKMENRKKMTQAEVVERMTTDLSYEIGKKEVREFFEVLNNIMVEELNIKKKSKKEGTAPGVFVIPYCGVQVQAKLMPKRPKRMGRNPSTGEPVEIAAKPAHYKLKARIMKRLKVAVGL